MYSLNSLPVLLLALVNTARCYSVVREYSGQNFFDGWDFYGSWDNLTNGDIWWLNSSQAYSQQLAYVTTAGNAVIKVDNTSNVPFNEKRNTVRVTTHDSYALGSLWIVDVHHLPYGCSVWPAFWSKGVEWPQGGEIDIIEAVNVMQENQMALHTNFSCSHTTPPTGQQLGISGTGQNGPDCSTGPGCTVLETKNNSYGPGFNTNGGGVWATQFDLAGVFIWYWSRGNIPASITGATSTSDIDLSDWGVPSASYPNTTCNMTENFQNQQLVMDITLCGDWAGIGVVYNATCGSSGPTGLCYNDNVVGPGSPRYDEAYFEVSYVRAYTTGTPSPTTLPFASGNGASAATTTGATGDPSVSPAVVTNKGFGRREMGNQGLALDLLMWTVLVGVLTGVAVTL
ncbi:hypothetical protein BD410DRAFT_786198 [Rickenella mellea]|uniref:GH16 domain-containing protein n=1 Tax=Rickenella mellea TaxID=50990 RepID=A0A4Y7QBL4_9AGAM|nr:hypothetical protein BD410DRAFT_786198 [Rickenella mellea]